ncbi:CKLF-like MARVEL transmembrane domain-containing protein 5 [Anolis carolinensis]|uniref:CKLF-like MARVEL transmembrane domain-containing protein 5 n=1 Tax=Anolis carolinensis TaxID=28377 RepID=UPI002F2B6264
MRGNRAGCQVDWEEQTPPFISSWAFFFLSRFLPPSAPNTHPSRQQQPQQQQEGLRGGRMGEHGDPAGGLQGFALDKEFLSSPKGILMEAELGLCFLVFILLTASISAYMGAALLEVLVTLAFLALRATHYYERLTRVNWPCLDFLRCVSAAIVFTVVAFAVIAASHEGSAVSAFVFSLILIAVFCFDAYKTYKAEMGSEQDPDLG